MINFEDTIFFCLLGLGLFIGPILKVNSTTEKLLPYRGEILGSIGCLYWFSVFGLTGFSSHLGYPSAILAMAASIISGELFGDYHSKR
ncbi:hypothetical protein [Periweissella fabalis]|uniref:Uncharacterized protein n=1 Tax=Periweissella fabalis TaxID=1070421 RepID=A0A7X6S246_9LACO|nr:hypothetical protein [Periweissella fabalis]MCM0599380.1 hypothetical protein [Periweissella fabalis]NKZ23659.1 hypothetical protein [Periweissella fabalis]